MRTFALIGRNIAYSFSRAYFAEKFSTEGITDAQYIHFDIPSIAELPYQIAQTPTLCGMNVTIPYKTAIIDFLDELDPTAAEIGAVNCIVKIPSNAKKGKISPNFRLKGYNTDWIGFYNTLLTLLTPHQEKALILGNGGASKAIAYALSKLQIPHKRVSRTPDNESIGYESLEELMPTHRLIINTTPLGTFPAIETCPEIPYNLFSSKHIAYDLVYNPSETLFLKKAQENGATTQNGYAMLVEQAKAAWQLWQNSSQ